MESSLNFYNEQDAKNQPLQQALNDTQKFILQSIGDSLNKAFYPSIDSVPFTTERPLYKKIDSPDSSFTFTQPILTARTLL